MEHDIEVIFNTFDILDYPWDQKGFYKHRCKNCSQYIDLLKIYTSQDIQVFFSNCAEKIIEDIIK